MTMAINGAILREAKIDFKTAFNKAFEMVEADPIMPFVLEMKHEGEKISQKWGNASPGMKPWLGEAQFSRLSAYDYEYTDELWQDGFEVSLTDIEDDRLNVYRSQLDSLASEAANFRPQKLQELLSAGFTSTCYDGQNFFDTDHADASETAQSNKVTTVLAEGSLWTGIATMRGVTNIAGKPLKLRPTHLLVPPALEKTATKLLEQDVIAAGESNISKGRVKLVVLDYLATDTEWYLTDARKPYGLVLAKRYERPEFAAQDDPTDDSVFEKRVVRYSAVDRFTVGYGLWQSWYGSTGAG
jgi:phage major head subunit gpT-like protein